MTSRSGPTARGFATPFSTGCRTGRSERSHTGSWSPAISSGSSTTGVTRSSGCSAGGAARSRLPGQAADPPASGRERSRALRAEPPESRRLTGLVGTARAAQAVLRPRSPVEEEQAAEVRGVRGGGQPDDRVGSFLRRPEQRPHDAAEAGKRGSEPGGVGPAGMHRVDGDAGVEQLSRPLLGQHDLCPLAARVCLRPVVGGGLGVEGIDVERLGVHAAGCHHDHARRCRRLEQRPQRTGQQERRQDVRRERRLVALARDRVFVGQRAGVQDEHVEAVVPRGEAGREGGGLREGREICEVGLDRGACRGGDLAAGAFGPLRVAPDDADVPAQRRDRLGGRSSEARGRPGHDCDLAVETEATAAASSRRGAAGCGSRSG